MEELEDGKPFLAIPDLNPKEVSSNYRSHCAFAFCSYRSSGFPQVPGYDWMFPSSKCQKYGLVALQLQAIKAGNIQYTMLASAN